MRGSTLRAVDTPSAIIIVSLGNTGKTASREGAAKAIK